MDMLLFCYLACLISHLGSICLFGLFLIYLQTVITLWPNNYFENMNCIVLSILRQAGLVQVFLVQSFSLFGPTDGLPVYCF